MMSCDVTSSYRNVTWCQGIIPWRHIISHKGFIWEFPLIQTKAWKSHFWPLDLDLWPTTLTYNPRMLRSRSTLITIKRVIDRDGATCERTTILNAQPFWMSLKMNTLRCYYWTFCCTWRPLHASGKRFRCESIKTTIWCQNTIFHRLTLTFDLRPRPTIPT